MLWAVASATYLGAAVELVISAHWAEWQQWVAFVAVGLGLAVVAWAWRTPSARSLAAVRAVSAAVAVVAVVGVVLHLKGNYGFSAEVSPDDTTWERMIDTFTGGNPAFAPGMVAVGAVLAYAATWRHAARS